LPRGILVDSLLPLLPLAAGTALSAWRFRADEPFAGVALALGGVLAMVLVVLVRDGVFRR
jgi:hypothetical protein